MEKNILNNDKEYLSAYSNHMLQVQRDLIQFRKNAQHGEFIIKKDEKVLKLQTHIAWFRDEALYLNSQKETF